jgi:hypothetical protein
MLTLDSLDEVQLGFTLGANSETPGDYDDTNAYDVTWEEVHRKNPSLSSPSSRTNLLPRDLSVAEHLARHVVPQSRTNANSALSASVSTNTTTSSSSSSVFRFPRILEILLGRPGSGFPRLGQPRNNVRPRPDLGATNPTDRFRLKMHSLTGFHPSWWDSKKKKKIQKAEKRSASSPLSSLVTASVANRFVVGDVDEEFNEVSLSCDTVLDVCQEEQEQERAGGQEKKRKTRRNDQRGRGFPGVRSTIENLWADVEAQRDRVKEYKKEKKKASRTFVGGALSLDSQRPVQLLLGQNLIGCGPGGGKRKVTKQPTYAGITHARLVDHHVAYLTNGRCPEGRMKTFFDEIATRSERARNRRLLQLMGWSPEKRLALDPATIHPLAWKVVADLLARGYHPVQASVDVCCLHPNLQTSVDLIWSKAPVNPTAKGARWELLVIELKKTNPVDFVIPAGKLKGCLAMHDNSPLQWAKTQVSLSTYLLCQTYRLDAFHVTPCVMNVWAEGIKIWPLDPSVACLTQPMLRDIVKTGQKLQKIREKPLEAHPEEGNATTGDGKRREPPEGWRRRKVSKKQKSTRSL